MLKIKNLFTEPHLYTVYDEKKRAYFSKDFESREDAKHALYNYIAKKNLSIVCKDGSTHCEQYVCDNGQSFYINREY